MRVMRQGEIRQGVWGETRDEGVISKAVMGGAAKYNLHIVGRVSDTHTRSLVTGTISQVTCSAERPSPPT